MRLLLALVLVLVAGVAHAATLHLSAPHHLPAARAASPPASPAVHSTLPARLATPSITFEVRRARHTRAPTSAVHDASAHPARQIERQTVAPGVIHVHDGDTFYVGPDAFRLRGIDTPELGQPRAEEARDRLRELLHSGPVTIVRRAEDVYGRIVADVFVGGRSVARILKAEGYAKPRTPRARRLRRTLYRSLDIFTARHAS